MQLCRKNMFEVTLLNTEDGATALCTALQIGALELFLWLVCFIFLWCQNGKWNAIPQMIYPLLKKTQTEGTITPRSVAIVYRMFMGAIKGRGWIVRFCQKCTARSP